MADARPWLFLGFTLGATWLLGWAAVALQDALPRWAVYALAYGGGLAPLGVAVALLHTVHDRADRRDFWLRLRDLRRIGTPWLAVALLLQPAVSLVAALVDRRQGGPGIAPEVASTAVDQPLLLLPLVVWWLAFGPLVEEPGWRGYALDGLQARRSALTASLVVGTAWASWHLPLFLLDGTWQAEQVGLGGPRFWTFNADVLLGSVLATWLYNNTGRSILAAVLLHFSGNAFGELFELSSRADLYDTVAMAVVVALIVSVWGPARLARRKGARWVGWPPG